MSWEGTYSHQVLLSLDLWAAGVFFNKSGLTVSTLAGLVRDQLDAPLKLYGWQRGVLGWIEPRLSNAHCEAARAADIARARVALSLMGATSAPGTGGT